MSWIIHEKKGKSLKEKKKKEIIRTCIFNLSVLLLRILLSTML